MTTDEPGPVLAVRPRQAAKLLGVSSRTLYEWTRRGLIPSVRVGHGRRKVVLYPVADLRAWLARQTTSARGGAVTPVQVLLERLSGVRKTSTGWSARCPAHDDRHRSLSISETTDGTVLVRCHAGCAAAAVVAALGLSLRDLFPSAGGPIPFTGGPPNSPTFPSAQAALAALEARRGKSSASWEYHDAAGDPVGLVVRWDGRDRGRTFAPCRDTATVGGSARCPTRARSTHCQP